MGNRWHIREWSSMATASMIAYLFFKKIAAIRMTATADTPTVSINGSTKNGVPDVEVVSFPHAHGATYHGMSDLSGMVIG